MSGCRAEDVEALLAGELGPAQQTEVQAHLEGCARCARERAWLEAERALFTQRALREAEPKALWRAVDARAHRSAPRLRASAERWRCVGLGVAASLLMVVTFGPRGRSLSRPSRDPVSSSAGRSFADELGFSPDPQGGIATLEQQYGACLVATPNAGSRCGELHSIPASFAFSSP